MVLSFIFWHQCLKGCKEEPTLQGLVYLFSPVLSLHEASLYRLKLHAGLGILTDGFKIRVFLSVHQFVCTMMACKTCRSAFNYFGLSSSFSNYLGARVPQSESTFKLLVAQMQTNSTCGQSKKDIKDKQDKKKQKRQKRKKRQKNWAGHHELLIFCFR